MRRAFIATIVLLAGCHHPRATARAPRAPAAATSPSVVEELCTAQRAENRRRAEGVRCVADEDCVRAGKYETGACDVWVTRPDADEVLRQMRAGTDAACRERERIVVTPACPPAVAACVSGRCVGKASGGPSASPVAAAQARPEDFRCLATALQRITAEKKLPLGRVELQFPLAVDGGPPRYFEAVGPQAPEAAVGVARAFGACRWTFGDGGAIPPGAWGSMSIMLED